MTKYRISWFLKEDRGEHSFNNPEGYTGWSSYLDRVCRVKCNLMDVFPEKVFFVEVRDG